MNIAEEHRKVLVVDDDPIVRHTLALCLQDAFDITAVPSGEMALEACKTETFPVVVLDLRMEGISGIETLRELKAKDEPPSVIILTAYESKETAISALNLGAFNYLTKPFDKNHLKQVVADGYKAFSRQRLRAQEMRKKLEEIHNTFFSILCHEFNTPLNGIIGFSGLLADSVQDPEHATWASEVCASADRLHEILMEMIDYVSVSHLAAEKIESEFDPRQLLEPLQAAFAKKNLSLEIVQEGDMRVCGSSKAVLVLARQLIKMIGRQHTAARVEIHHSGRENGSSELHLRISGAPASLKKQKTPEEWEVFPLWHALSGEGKEVDFDTEISALRKVADHAGGSIEHHRTVRGADHFLLRVPVHPAEKSSPIK